MAIADQLPQECWIMIANQLRGGQDCFDAHNRHLNNLSLVSKQFLSVARTVRRKISLRKIIHHDRLDTRRFLCSDRYPNVTVVSVDCNAVHSNIFTDISTSGLDLHELEMDWRTMCRAPIESWGLLGQTLKNLQVLKFRNAGTLNADDFIAIADAFPMLEELDLSNIDNRITPAKNFCLSDDGVEAVSKKLTKLQRIDLSGTQCLSDKSILALIQNCVFLTEARFPGWNVTDQWTMLGLLGDYIFTGVVKYNSNTQSFLINRKT